MSTESTALPLDLRLPVPGYGFTRLEQSLLELAGAVVREPDTRAFLERLLREARRLTRAEAGAILLRDGERLEPVTVQNDLLSARLGERQMRRLQGEAIGLDRPSLPGLVVTTGQAVNVEDVDATYPGDPIFDAGAAARGYRTRSLLAVPLPAPDQTVLGVLQLVNAHVAPDVIVGFTEEDEAVARAMAGLAAMIVHRAHLDARTFRDGLTDLFNRRYIELRLAEESGRHARWGDPVSVVAVDVDGFRRVTEREGAGAAGRTLRELAGLLRRQSRRFTVLARARRDRFAVVLANTPQEGALAYAERLRGAIESHDFQGARLTASFGVAALGPGRDAPEPLLAAADDAVDEAKRRGRNRVVAAASPP